MPDHPLVKVTQRKRVAAVGSPAGASASDAAGAIYAQPRRIRSLSRASSGLRSEKSWFSRTSRSSAVPCTTFAAASCSSPSATLAHESLGLSFRDYIPSATRTGVRGVAGYDCERAARVDAEQSECHADAADRLAHRPPARVDQRLTRPDRVPSIETYPLAAGPGLVVHTRRSKPEAMAVRPGSSGRVTYAKRGLSKPRLPRPRASLRPARSWVHSPPI